MLRVIRKSLFSVVFRPLHNLAKRPILLLCLLQKFELVWIFLDELRKSLRLFNVSVGQSVRLVTAICLFVLIYSGSTNVGQSWPEMNGGVCWQIDFQINVPFESN